MYSSGKSQEWMTCVKIENQEEKKYREWKIVNNFRQKFWKLQIIKKWSFCPQREKEAMKILY